MLSFKLKVSPLCNILLKRPSTYKQVVYSNTLYTHRLPLKDKHLPTVATCCYVEHYLNSVATELVPLCNIFIYQHGKLCHSVGDFHPVRREGDTQWNKVRSLAGRGLVLGFGTFCLSFWKVYFSLQKDAHVRGSSETVNGGFLSTLPSAPTTPKDPRLCSSSLARSLD